MLGVRRVADTDVAIGIDDVLVREDAITDHQITHGLVEFTHEVPLNAN
jgi:hypothetical protein